MFGDLTFLSIAKCITTSNTAETIKDSIIVCTLAHPKEQILPMSSTSTLSRVSCDFKLGTCQETWKNLVFHVFLENMENLWKTQKTWKTWKPKTIGKP